ncbi:MULTISPECIES: AfsR/SARP family transcriptional regulator [unclassified Streptomyces]|uniref:AfsR/SARP family transcriptional regulator n=1 Tax=unclassified Streptomyces TaxID=2593676 RepID=UPI00073B563B|nr:AfsR/SARP family transcriptional regulator [Streptomyces sp. AVP053U2]ODA75211.1 Transcriptional regulatory protein EmbR [Streptomyces sp. AVP053U2]
MRVVFGVLGPVVAWNADADADAGAGAEAGAEGSGRTAIALKGPRHRSVLARLIIARGRVVPLRRLIDDLWPDPPGDAVGSVRTFVAALRRALEPERAPRTPAGLLVTEGPGYALRAAADEVDAWCFEQEVTAAAALPPTDVASRLGEVLGRWRGPAYAEFADQPWARAESRRLTELRLHAVERHAEALLALGHPERAAADLRVHTTEHPWREHAWRLLALALYRAGRQGDALAVLRQARTALAEELGIEPGPGLRGLEADILHQADPARPASGTGGTAGQVWERAAASYDRTVATSARARLESTVGLLRDLAVAGGGGGLPAAFEHRVSAVMAAEELGDAELTARVIGAYDVPAIWTRSDDPKQAAHIVRAAERTLAALPAGGHEAAKARLLATIALESRGTGGLRGPQAARQAEQLARGLGDPALLAFTLNAVFMQSFDRTGLAPRREAIGRELTDVSARHGLATFEILGHLVRLQARGALGDFPSADRHAAAADRLAARHERPLVAVFTRWYAALRLDATGRAPAPEAEAAYRDAAALLDGCGMPGLARGLLPLALLCLRLRRGLSPRFDGTVDWGPYADWVRPLMLLEQGSRAEAAEALHGTPEPPRDLLQEALWCLTARAALALGDRDGMRRARTALAPAAGELAGAGSGLLTLGPVSAHLADLSVALKDT